MNQYKELWQLLICGFKCIGIALATMVRITWKRFINYNEHL